MSFSSDQPLLSNQVPISLDIPPPNDPHFQDIISLFTKRVSDIINTKEGALHTLQEIATFQQYFSYVDPTVVPPVPQPFIFRPGYRRTYDLVALFGAAIPTGTTTIALTGSNLIVTNAGFLDPVNGYTAATAAGPIYYFNGIYLDVRFDNTSSSAQNIIIQNNTGSTLTSCIYNFEYLKIP